MIINENQLIKKSVIFLSNKSLKSFHLGKGKTLLKPEKHKEKPTGLCNFDSVILKYLT